MQNQRDKEITKNNQELTDFVLAHPERFHSIGEYYRERFNGRAKVIPVAIASTCPNRLGLKGMQTCIFCDEWGSAADNDMLNLSFSEQVDTKIKLFKDKYRSENFIVYFQAYTNSFVSVRTIEACMQEAEQFSDIKGFIVGTRPDCLSKKFLEILNREGINKYVAVELGIQSLDDEQLEFLRRGHTRQQSIEAIQKISEYPNIETGIHLMFGIPGETTDQIIETARLVSSLPVKQVKLHNLHVLSGTPLEDLYHQGQFEPETIESYSEKVVLFLQHLRPDIVVQRLSAVASRWDELVAPQWTRHKMKTRNFIVNAIKNANAYQGQFST